MSANPETELLGQVNDSRSNHDIESVLQPGQSECPISKEISQRLRISPVISKSHSVDVGNVGLSRDDFCPESAHCVLCSFVVKLRSARTNNVSLSSVHFVLDDWTYRMLRSWLNTQITNETPRLSHEFSSDFTIVITSGAEAFQRVHWHVYKPYEEPREHKSKSCILGLFRLWKYQAPDCNLPAPKLDTLTYIAKQAKQWLRLCDEGHELCEYPVSNFTSPITLIDCNQHCLVHGFAGISYVALSYVWGKTGRNFNIPQREYGIKLGGLPRTISDAILVTKSIGYDYLWVDMLCIDQQSKEDKHRQIAIMDQIYRSADLTIIVAAGSDCGDGIPGVSERCRPPRMSIKIGNSIMVEDKEDIVQELEASVWRSRGWTFQEGLLSRRRLAFTESQMLFSCLSGQETEPREGPEFPHQANEAETLSFSFLGLRARVKLWDSSFLQINEAPSGGICIIAFAELLEKYSTLEFSFESDIANAFRAIGNTFALKTRPVLHLHGLPFILHDWSVISSSLTRGLAWSSVKGNEGTARRPGFPSWSWLGYRGPVQWGAKLGEDVSSRIDTHWKVRTFSHVKSMVTISNRKFDLSQLPHWWLEWSSAETSEDLSPSRLLISGYMITQNTWLSAECTTTRSARYILTGKGARFSTLQYQVGDNLMMSANTCQCLLKSLRRGSWKALLLTDGFLLFIQSVATGDKSGPYRRVASTDIYISNTRNSYVEETNNFVNKCTDLIEVELV